MEILELTTPEPRRADIIVEDITVEYITGFGKPWALLIMAYLAPDNIPDMKYGILPIFVGLFLGLGAPKAQVVNTATIDTLANVQVGNMSIGGFIDTYYSYNSSLPSSKNIDYLSSSARHNEMNINLAYLDLRYSSPRLQSRLVAGYGTFMMVNYQNEPEPLKFLLEASIGVKPFKNYNAWISAGVIGSPFTNESYASKDQLMYTRSLSSENTPYYLTGIKAQFPLSEKLSLSVYGINGWQNITEYNEGKAVATQLEYRPNKKLILNWNTYIGDEMSDSTPEYRTRLFNDVFLIYSGKKWDFTSSMYLGMQMKKDSLGSESNPIWYSLNGIARYRFNSTFSLSGRLEYFRDQDNVLVQPQTQNKNFHVLGSGLCFNVHGWDRFLFRIEGRYFYGFERVFRNAKGAEARHNGQITVGISAWF
ncbi:MAG: outer membrane beta-barrel protein [Bacteroidetes bacterium]|nr:outer membrane beta-barrel protein [Bacteroidota bacterium]